VLDGEPSASLIEASLDAEPTGAVLAYLAEGTWHYVREQDESLIRGQGTTSGPCTSPSSPPGCLPATTSDGQRRGTTLPENTTHATIRPDPTRARQAAALSALLDAIDLCDRATARLAVILARLGSSPVSPAAAAADRRSDMPTTLDLIRDFLPCSTPPPTPRSTPTPPRRGVVRAGDWLLWLAARAGVDGPRPRARLVCGRAPGAPATCRRASPGRGSRIETAEAGPVERSR